jgi:hypothetical protein
MSYVVRVGFDEALRRYFVQDSDISGLNVETENFEESVEIVRDVAPDLLDQSAVGVRRRHCERSEAIHFSVMERLRV